MNYGQARIVCPRCRANNFPGLPHCFQCGGSLPPPEAVGQPAAAPHNNGRLAAPADPRLPHFQAQNARPYASAGGANRAAWRVVVPIVLILCVLCGALFFLAHRARSRAGVSGSSDIRAQVDELDRLRSQHGLSPAGSSPTAPSTSTEADRELSRLREKIYGPGGSSSEGGGGGSARPGGPITFEQWQHNHGDASSYMFH